MKTYLDCYPCLLRQALSAARHAGATAEEQHGILLETMDQLRSLPADTTPPVLAEQIHRLARTETNSPDPYRELKREATEQALTLLPGLMEKTRTASDPLETAVRIADASRPLLRRFSPTLRAGGSNRCKGSSQLRDPQ